MGDISAVAQKSSYLFTVTVTAAEQESSRLDKQYAWLKKCACQGRLIYDDSIQLKPGDVILDAATGSGAWLLDAASQVPDEVELYGVDISTKTLPSSPPSNVKFVEASVTSLPSEWNGKFDLVNQRLLIAALRAEEWPQAISELYRTVKAGGHVQLLEYSYHRPITSDTQRQFFNILLALFAAKGLSPYISDRIPSLLEEAGFTDVVVRRENIPIAASLGEDGKIGADNFGDVWRNWKTAIMQHGGFGLIDSEDEYDSILDTILAEYEAEGMMFPVDVIYAQKPLS